MMLNIENNNSKEDLGASFIAALGSLNGMDATRPEAIMGSRFFVLIERLALFASAEHALLDGINAAVDKASKQSKTPEEWAELLSVVTSSRQAMAWFAKESDFALRYNNMVKDQLLEEAAVDKTDDVAVRAFFSKVNSLFIQPKQNITLN